MVEKEMFGYSLGNRDGGLLAWFLGFENRYHCEGHIK